MTLSAQVKTQIITTGTVSAPRQIDGAVVEVQGPPGRNGAGDHGFIVYGEGSSAAAITLAPGVRQQLEFSTALQNDSILAASAFKGHVFWDGATVRSRASGDTAIVRLDLTSDARVANGNIEIQLDIGGGFGIIQQVSRALKAPAGDIERISEAFPIYMGPTFLANGGAIFLETSVPTDIQMVSLIIFPLTAAS